MLTTIWQEITYIKRSIEVQELEESFKSLVILLLASNFIAGRTQAALLFWFFCDFRCDVPLFVVVLVTCNIKTGKNRC